MLLDRIDHFDIFRPKMDATKEVLHAIATFTADISPAFPYVNAELGGWDYNQANQVLLLKLSDGKEFTIRPHEIAVKGAQDIGKPTPCLLGSRDRSTISMNARKRSHPGILARPDSELWTS